MKKIIALVLSFVMMLNFVACGGGIEPSQDDKVVLVRGSYNEDKTVFTNESMDVTLNVPEDWYIYTDNDLASTFLEDVTGDQLAAWTQEDFAQRITIPDMAMGDLFIGTNISLQYENLDVTANGLDIDEEQYAKLSKKQLDSVGFGYEYSELEDVQLNGNDYKWFSAKGTYDGLDFTQYFMVRRVGNYMVILCATTYTEEPAQVFFDMLP